MKFKTCNKVSCPKRHLPHQPNFLRRIPSDLTQICRKGDECMNPVCCFRHPTRWINGLRYKEDPSDIPINTSKPKGLARIDNIDLTQVPNKINDMIDEDQMVF